MRRCDWLVSRCSTSVCGAKSGAGSYGVGLGQRGEAREALLQLRLVGQVVEVADEEGATARAGPAALAEGDDALAREAAQVLLRAEHGAPERVLAERGAVDQVLGDHRRLVEGAVDLLDHDAALAVELLGVDPRAPDEVATAGRSPRGALSARTVMWKATRSWLVYALSTPPSRSAVSLTSL